MANTDGFTVPGYQIEKKLGSGGMSDVYLVRDNLNRLYALKALAPSLQQDTGFRQRFRSEAQIMASLTHPNIVQLHSYIEDEPRYCLAMEYMSGGSLKDMLRGTGPIIESRALAYLKQIVSGMAYAHAKGVIHRDIKPANILVGGDGSMKITDFGIARISDSEGFTRTGTRMGTVVYMSPEQIADSKHVSPASDVFSLGVTFWEMLTGKTPYDENTESEFKILEKIVYQDLPDPREVYPHISEHTIQILRGMTQRDVNKRLSIDAVLQMLEGKETVTAPAPQAYIRPTVVKPEAETAVEAVEEEKPISAWWYFPLVFITPVFELLAIIIIDAHRLVSGIPTYIQVSYWGLVFATLTAFAYSLISPSARSKMFKLTNYLLGLKVVVWALIVVLFAL